MKHFKGLNQKKYSYAVIFACVLFFRALATAKTGVDYRFDGWATDDGLPQNSVLAVTQTRDGYLWFTTFDGLTRFDGVKFTVFDKTNTAAVVGNRFTSLLEDADGALWAGSEYGGLIRYQNDVFQKFQLSGDAADTTVRGIQQTTDGELIAATDSALFRRTGQNSFEPFSAGGETVERKILWSKSGAKWTIDASGLHENRDGRTTDYAVYVKSIPPENLLYEDSRGALWIGEAETFYRMKNGVMTRFEKSGDRVQVNRADINLPECVFYENTDGSIWAGGADGLTIFDPNDGQRRHYTTADGLPSNFIRSIYGDREGSVWLGTLNRGIIRASRKFISTYSAANGLKGENINPVFADRAGQIWLGSSIVEKINGDVITHYDQTKLKNLGDPQSIGEDDKGRVWIGFYSGIGYFEGDKFTDLSDFLGRYTFNVIREDRDGALWFGTNAGLIKLQNGEKTIYSAQNGLPDGEIKDVYEDANGALWIAAYGGLSKFENGKFTTYTKRDGLPGNLVRTITGEADGTLWIGTYGSGLARLKDGVFTNYTTANGLFNNGVFRILDDGAGNFWMSSNRGIYRVAKQQLNDFADGKIASFTSVAYGKEDGMLSTECNGGRQPAGAKTADGKLWFPTQQGVVVVDPQAILFNKQPPPVVIESVKIDNREIDKPSEDISLQPGQTSLEIGYTGLSLIKSEQVRFRYRLENLDDNWTEAGTRRSAYYSYLPPGEYVFQVIAANSDGVWNETGKSIVVRVVPPFYRTWWFYIGSILAMFAAVFAVYRLRLRQIETKHREQEMFSRRLIDSQEQERKRIAAELHDSLGQLLVVIKNRARLGLKVENNAEATENHLDGISGAASQAIEEVKEISFNLRPYLLDKLGLTKTLKSMLGKVFEASGINLTTDIDDVDDVFPKDSEILFYRIVQETVNNIIKHSEAKNAEISIKRAGNLLILTISDDGKGFDKAAQAQSLNRSFGLIGIAERARLLDGTHFFASETGKGTRLTVRIDLQNA